ncbi:MAG TPA: 2TM domain-containing protein [Acidimicrobiales bacterium]|nr:2TM domain-containing protein [Acidimicrobiales bacterium]
MTLQDKAGPPAVTPADPADAGSTVASEREWARKQIERRRKLRADVSAYVVINVCLIAAWAATGFGYFWPGWVLVGWGAMLFLDYWNYRGRQPISEQDIDRELHRRR